MIKIKWMYTIIVHYRIKNTEIIKTKLKKERKRKSKSKKANF